MNRRLLLHSVVVGVPVAVVSSAVSRAVGGPEAAVAARSNVAGCQSGVGRVVTWGGPVNGLPPYQALMPPVPMVFQSGVTAVAATNSYVFALKGGRVRGFGYYSYSGVWTLDQVWKIPTDATAGVTAISALGENILALRDGRVIAWGGNNGVLAVPDEAKSGVTAISCGGTYGLALKDGGVVQWIGGPAPVPDEAKSGITAISAGGAHALALREDGRVVAWGPTTSAAATQVPEEARSGVTAVEAGGGGFGGGPFSLAVKNGRVISWGTNDKGQLEAPADPDVVAVAAGALNGMSLTKQGAVNVWSINNGHQLEIPDEVCKASAIAMGYNLCVALV
jgi:hypothetical protein